MKNRLKLVILAGSLMTTISVFAFDQDVVIGKETKLRVVFHPNAPSAILYHYLFQVIENGHEKGRIQIEDGGGNKPEPRSRLFVASPQPLSQWVLIRRDQQGRENQYIILSRNSEGSTTLSNGKSYQDLESKELLYISPQKTESFVTTNTVTAKAHSSEFKKLFKKFSEHPERFQDLLQKQGWSEVDLTK